MQCLLLKISLQLGDRCSQCKGLTNGRNKLTGGCTFFVYIIGIQYRSYILFFTQGVNQVWVYMSRNCVWRAADNIQRYYRRKIFLVFMGTQQHDGENLHLKNGYTLHQTQYPYLDREPKYLKVYPYMLEVFYKSDKNSC